MSMYFVVPLLVALIATIVFVSAMLRRHHAEKADHTAAPLVLRAIRQQKDDLLDDMKALAEASENLKPFIKKVGRADPESSDEEYWWIALLDTNEKVLKTADDISTAISQLIGDFEYWKHEREIRQRLSQRLSLPLEEIHEILDGTRQPADIQQFIKINTEVREDYPHMGTRCGGVRRF